MHVLNDLKTMGRQTLGGFMTVIMPEGAWNAPRHVVAGKAAAAAAKSND